MRTRTYIRILAVAASPLCFACGSPDRTFVEVDGGTPPSNDGSSNSDAMPDATAAPDQQGGNDGAVSPDAPRADASPDARPDAEDARADAPADNAPSADTTPDIVVADTSVPDATVDTGGALDVASEPDAVSVVDAKVDVLDCTGTSAPRISPAGSAAFCPGKTVTLTSSSAPSYLWSTTATTPSIDVGVAGSYTVTTTDGRGCMATSSPTVVTAYPAPTPTISASGSTRFCQGGSVTLTAAIATTGSTYSWSNGATTPSIVVNASGSYTVAVTDTNGCGATSAPTVVTVVTPSTGSRSYAFAGAVDTFTVPECVTSLQVDAYGAQGGTSNSGGVGGYGGYVSARLTVTPNATLQIRVGGAGVLCSSSNVGGYNGGASANCTGYDDGAGGFYYSGSGGGATDLRVTPYTLDDRVIVVGGGGGAGYDCSDTTDNGAPGGGAIGGRTNPACSGPDSSGGGGTQAGGGVGGTIGGYGYAGAGLYGFGGIGGCPGGMYMDREGGGGGGGYYGGGGGCWVGGGGGSDYLRSTVTSMVTQLPGLNAGNGFVNLNW